MKRRFAVVLTPLKNGWHMAYVPELDINTQGRDVAGSLSMAKDVINYLWSDNTVCNSSLLSRQAVGDIISVKKKANSVQRHEKINVNLQIIKISKHISNFDFEEEFEEI